jgi:hypothetical protein
MKRSSDDPGNKINKIPVTKSPTGFLKYSGLAMQMLGTILVFTYAGYKLDEWQENKVPIWTLILSLTSIAASLYLLIRSFVKK